MWIWGDRLAEALELRAIQGPHGGDLGLQDRYHMMWMSYSDTDIKELLTQLQFDITYAVR